MSTVQEIPGSSKKAGVDLRKAMNHENATDVIKRLTDALPIILKALENLLGDRPRPGKNVFRGA